MKSGSVGADLEIKLFPSLFLNSAVAICGKLCKLESADERPYRLLRILLLSNGEYIRSEYYFAFSTVVKEKQPKKWP